jgi:hypothetical protein
MFLILGLIVGLFTGLAIGRWMACVEEAEEVGYLLTEIDEQERILRLAHIANEDAAERYSKELGKLYDKRKAILVAAIELTRVIEENDPTFNEKQNKS